MWLMLVVGWSPSGLPFLFSLSFNLYVEDLGCMCEWPMLSLKIHAKAPRTPGHYVSGCQSLSWARCPLPITLQGKMISKVGMLSDKVIHLGTEWGKALGMSVGSDFFLVLSPGMTAMAFVWVMPKSQAAVDSTELASGTVRKVPLETFAPLTCNAALNKCCNLFETQSLPYKCWQWYIFSRAIVRVKIR